MKVCGAKLRFEKSRGWGDDSAANGMIVRYCDTTDGRWGLRTEDVTVYEGIWGSWKAMVMCPPNSWVTSIKTRIEEYAGNDDDTAWNGLQMRCRYANWEKAKEITVYEGKWGTWNDWTPDEHAKGLSGIGMGYFVDSVREKFEDPVGGNRDDTAGNGL